MCYPLLHTKQRENYTQRFYVAKYTIIPNITSVITGHKQHGFWEGFYCKIQIKILFQKLADEIINIGGRIGKMEQL